MWFGGIAMLVLFILHKISNRRNFTVGRFERKVGGSRPDPDELPDPGPSLRRARIQIIMAAIGIAIVTFIAFAGIGEKPVGIPLPAWFFDAFR